MHQQFESPASVVATVRRIWKPTFDAMATPFSAVCGAYATLEDDVLTRAVIPPGAIVYANPAYAPQDMANGAAGLEVHLRKLVEVDVRARGCSLVAPVWVHTKPPVIMDTHATRRVYPRVYRTRRVYTNYQKVQANCCNPHIPRHISLFLSRDSVVASQQRAAMYGDTQKFKSDHRQPRRSQ